MGQKKQALGINMKKIFWKVYDFASFDNEFVKNVGEKVIDIMIQHS